MAAKTIIITGAAKGIGLAISRFLLEAPERHNIVALGRDEEALESLRKSYPAQVKYISGHLEDYIPSAKAVGLARTCFGRIDALIVNHGTLGKVSKIADTDISSFLSTLETNFVSAVACCKVTIPELRKSKGKIIFTSSGAAENAYSSWGAYGASKAALNHLAMTLKNEEPDIITVSIRPGVVDTNMQNLIRGDAAESMAPHDRDKFANLKRDGKLLAPEKPGNVIARLALGATPNLNGQFLSWNDTSLSDFQD